MADTAPYRHTQVGWAIILPVSLGGGLALWILSAPELQVWLYLALAIFVLVLALFYALTISIEGGQIVARFGVGLIKKRIALSDVRTFSKVRNKWWYGWGLRMYPGGWLYNVQGLDAVELRLNDGGGIRFGTDEPDALMKALEAELGAPAPLSAEEQKVHDKKAKKFGIVAAVLVIVLVAVIGGALYAQTRPLKVTVSDGAFSLEDPMYSGTWKLEDVKELTLLEEMPDILMRTNGFALGATLRGHFKVEGLGEGQVYVENDTPPWILAKTAESFVLFNKDVGEDTRKLFAELEGK